MNIRERRAEPARPTKGVYESESGIALILTLAILVMVTVLVVAFAVSMRVENTASKNFNDLIKARQIAQAAVDQAVANIRGATPPISPGVNYVTSPGAIYTLVAGVWVPHPLYTAYPVVNTGSVDLNQDSLITGMGNGDFLPGGLPLWAGWSNIVVAVNGAPEVVGRFAYWVDDESAKVNLNVAGSRGSDLEGYTPAAIDIQSLNFLPGDQVNITNYVSTVRPLDTIKSIQIPTLPNVSTPTYSNNQFYVTVNSTSPDITPWGTKRTNFVGVANDPGLTADQKVLIISNAFDDANLATWFGAGQTFGAKYPNLAQVAANIIDYIDFDNKPTQDLASSSNPQGPTPPSYLGLEETPYFNELVISNSILVAGTADATSLSFQTTAYVELWYMYTNSAGWNAGPLITSTKAQLLFSPTVSITVSTVAPAVVTPPAIPTIAFAPLLTGGTITINAGGGIHALGGVNPSYDVLPGPIAAAIPVSINTNIAYIILNPGTVTAIYFNGAGRLDYASIPLTNYIIAIPDTTLLTVTNVAWVTACNDLRVKPVSNDWFTQGGTTNQGVDTLRAANTGLLNPQVINTNTAGTVFVPADGDFSCHVVSVDLIPSGSRNRGAMTPGELSFIHTGYPWRTFSLQPQAAGESGPPDWALLDLFSGTDTTNVVGRMNINSAISVYNAGALPGRLLPLRALLTNNFSVAGGGTLQNNYARVTAVGNLYAYPYTTTTAYRAVMPPGSGPFCQSAYTMVGEVANTQSLSDTQTGVPPNATSKSNRETPVRGIANLITTRSDTFTVWVVAQSIKALNKNGSFNPGNDLITGEVKVQAIVQRTADYSVTPPQVSFRTLYYRYIYN